MYVHIISSFESFTRNNHIILSYHSCSLNSDKKLILNYRRMSEIGRRRYTLNQFYAHCNFLGCVDPSIKYEVQKFLLVTKDANDIHENFLTKSPSGLLNGLQAKRLRTGLAPFLMDSLVCVQLGNYHWSEECLGLTVGDLIFIKHSNRLRGAIRLCLPLNTIIEGYCTSSFHSLPPSFNYSTLLYPANRYICHLRIFHCYKHQFFFMSDLSLTFHAWIIKTLLLYYSSTILLYITLRSSLPF